MSVKLSDDDEALISQAEMIQALRRDYDEADKEILLLKIENARLRQWGSKLEMKLISSLCDRLRKYEPAFKLGAALNG